MAKQDTTTSTAIPKQYVSTTSVCVTGDHLQIIYSHDLKPEGDKVLALEEPNTSKSVLEEFNEKFQREANEYDKDILKRNYDLNTTLIFVSDS